MNALISVVLPVYNAEKWLADSLHSLTTQKGPGSEVIVIDDGSTDGTSEILERFQRHDLRITCLRNERNSGIVYSLNRGLNHANGRFIARMDADDVAMPNRFARQIAFLEQTGCDLCGSWFIEFGQGISRTVHWPYEEHSVHTAMLFQNSILHPTIMARREVFEEFQYREEYRLAEDYDLFSRACGRFRFANVPEALLRYRRHPRQETQTKRTEMELVTGRIRIQALRQQGYEPTPEEQRVHNLIRAPRSISDLHDLEAIERWLLKLYGTQTAIPAKQIIASQWVRACIRAAPLKKRMWNTFIRSPLHKAAGAKLTSDMDIYILSRIGLAYDSRPFNILRHFGINL
ncbi:MAG: glycosyltransferase family 2 protein [Gammaproteobacteria bacterium]